MKQNYTQEALARLGVFKFSEFRYIPRMNDSIVTDTLDVRVNATFDLPYDSELELNVTTKSTKQTGPGAIFNLSRKLPAHGSISQPGIKRFLRVADQFDRRWRKFCHELL